MSSGNVNVSNLRTYLINTVANQAKATQASYTNKYSLVNAVATTSQYMNINPNTGTISVTGNIVVPQPVINPVLVNTTTAFVSTKDNQVSVTSKGEEDTIITPKIVTIGNISQLTTGSNTLNNSINNINNNITTDFWNPQFNLDQLKQGYILYPYTLYPIIINYTFTEKKTIFKLFIKNKISNLNYNFPGFINIKIYPTNNPSNYINVKPAEDINNLYNNETQVLLLSDNGTPYFSNVDNLTLEINMTPKTSESYQEYTYGPNTGVIYNSLINEGKYQTAVVNGEYIYISSDYGSTWTQKTTYSKNWSAVSVSASGQYQTAVVNGEYIYISSDYGSTWTQKTTYSKNWSSVSMSDNGQYQYASANTNDYIYISVNYGTTWTLTSSPQKNWKSVSVSYNGSIINAVVYDDFRYYSLDYGSTWTQNNTTNYLSSTGTYISTNLKQNWNSVSCNSGGFSFFCINGGQLYNSSLKNDDAFARDFFTANWTSISCSTSGKYASACSSNNVIYKSSNYGYNWISTNSSSLNWSSISISRGYSSTDSTIGLRAGDYVSYNNSNGEIDKWTTPTFVDNFSTVTGTSESGNKNYFSSNSGNVQVVASSSLYGYAFYSHDSGKTWTSQVESGSGTDDMVISDDGQYGLYTKRGVYGVYNTFNQMSCDFNTNRITNYTNNVIDPDYPAFSSIDKYNCAMSSNGKYQFYIGQYTGTGTNFFGTNYFFYKKNYNTGNNLVWTLIDYTSFFGTITYVDSFVNINGDIYIVYNSSDLNRPLVIVFTSSSNYTSIAYVSLQLNTIVYSLGVNKTNISATDATYITLLGWNFTTSQPIICNIGNGTIIYNNITVVSPYPTTIPNGIINTAVKVSSTGQYQVATFTYTVPITLDEMPCVIYYTHNYGTTWTKCENFFYINILKSKNPIVANDDFSYITICGGYAPGNIASGNRGNIKPCTYYSTDRGVTWNFNSSINPATQLQTIAFYYAETQTNKTYFQVKDLNQTQVLGVSDNGFKMTKDLRVTNANGYIIGGNMTIGPNETSSLLNNYTLNVDGTVSCRNVVTLSDKRFKNILGNVSDKESYDKISNLNIINYKYIDREDNRVYTGMIAQDVHNIFEDAVDIRKSTYMNNEGTIEMPDIYSIKYNVINSYLISAFKYSQSYINKIENECNNLKNELNTIKLALNLTDTTNTTTTDTTTTDTTTTDTTTTDTTTTDTTTTDTTTNLITNLITDVTKISITTTNNDNSDI